MTKDILYTKIEQVPGNGAVMQPSYEGDAGYDLIVSTGTYLPPHEVVNVPCGIRIALPEGYSALVIPRSSIVRRGVLVFQTLIDNGYRGPLYVIAQNQNPMRLLVKPGERIAQLLPVPNTRFNVLEVASLPDSERGQNGFGSTGS